MGTDGREQRLFIGTGGEKRAAVLRVHASPSSHEVEEDTMEYARSVEAMVGVRPRS